MWLPAPTPIDVISRRDISATKASLRPTKAVQAKNHVIGCYVGVLGETALRMTQGLLLKWKFVNLGERTLTVEASKNYKTRHVPPCDSAVELLRPLPRVIGWEYVFALTLTKDRWRDPRGPFYAGRTEVDRDRAGFTISGISGRVSGS